LLYFGSSRRDLKGAAAGPRPQPQRREGAASRGREHLIVFELASEEKYLVIRDQVPCITTKFYICWISPIHRHMMHIF
jgi:hypothetical protein